MKITHSTSPTHQIGNKVEDIAKAYLLQQGFGLVAQNWHVAGVGEIDLIVERNQLLVFCEVKYRKNSGYGSAESSVSVSKQKKIMATAAYFLAENQAFDAYDCRFDVMAFAQLAKHVFDKDTAYTPQWFNQLMHNHQMNWIQAAFFAD